MLNKLTTRRGGFTLVEIMIVVAIIALLAAIAVPGFLRARKRSQASKIINDLRLIDSAVDQYAIETTKKTGDPVAVSDWTNYLKKDTNLYATGQDLFGDARTLSYLPLPGPVTVTSTSQTGRPVNFSYCRICRCSPVVSPKHRGAL